MKKQKEKKKNFYSFNNIETYCGQLFEKQVPKQFKPCYFYNLIISPFLTSTKKNFNIIIWDLFPNYFKTSYMI